MRQMMSYRTYFAAGKIKKKKNYLHNTKSSKCHGKGRNKSENRVAFEPGLEEQVCFQQMEMEKGLWEVQTGYLINAVELLSRKQQQQKFLPVLAMSS